jgi:hypothetical protein
MYTPHPVDTYKTHHNIRIDSCQIIVSILNLLPRNALVFFVMLLYLILSTSIKYTVLKKITGREIQQRVLNNMHLRLC